MNTKLLSICGVGLAMLLAPVAHAQEAAPVAPAEAGRGVQEHDGFFLRLSPQIGYLTSKMTVDPNPLDVEASASGIGIGGEILLGGTLGNGFVLGAGLGGMTVPSPNVEFEVNGEKLDSDDDADNLQYSTLTLFADWYPNPRDGLHIQGSVGFGVLDTDDNDDDDAATGPVFGLGAGYEWWISDQWSAGIMGRLEYAALRHTEKSFNQEVTEKYSTFVPSVLATFTFH